MAMNPYVGWSVTTLLSWFLNKGSNSSSESDSEPEELSIAETKTGTPVPVVMGRALIKSPLVIYYGDFRADIYTETYAAHANFSAWPVILTTLLEWMTKPKTGDTATKHTHDWSGGNSGGPVKGTTTENRPDPIPTKEKEGPKYLMLLAQWLLMWLINGRNLKTTMQKGFKYYLGYQMLACWSGPNLRLRGIYLGQTKVWEGNEAREVHHDAPFVFTVNNDELFGGPDENGGFIGDIRVYLGGDNQPADSWMQQQMQADNIDEELRGLTPAYRPFVSLVVPTAYVGKQATIPETWLDIQFCPDRLGLGPIGDDANPAEILYELHVNREWGLCESPDLLDLDSLLAIGQKLQDEKLGVTVTLSDKSEARSVVDSLCDHVNMVRYVDPRTGKLTFKLIRDDYDAATVPVLNEKNCSSITLTRLDWRETVGEICVTYTDRSAQYEQSNITENDPANVEINAGAKTTKTYDYPYFTTAENALWAAKRESKQQGYPLASVSIEGNRQLSSLRTGEVVCLNWAPYGIKNMLLRITDVDIGDFTGGTVKLEALEDVFGLEKTEFGFPGSPGWTKEPVYPTRVQDFRYLELPWELMPSPDSYVFAMAARPDPKTQRWTVWRQRSGASWESTSSMTRWTAAGRLVYDYEEFTDAEDMAGFEIADLGGLDQLKSGVLAGGAPDLVSARRGGKVLVIGEEIMAWSSLVQLPNGNWRVQGILRGVHDTVPAAHGAGDNVFFLDSGSYANVTTGGPVIAAGETTQEAYNITTSTVDAEETFDYTKVKSLSTRRRPERPNPPGRLRLSAHLVENVIHTDTLIGDVELAWAPRNKLFSFGCVSQNDAQEYWTGAAFTTPDKADYLIRVYVGGTLAAEHSILDAGWVYSWAQRCRDSRNLLDTTRLELYTRVNGLESYQPQQRTFTWNIPTLADGCESEAEALERLAEWGTADRILIPAGPLTEEKQILYTEMPVLLLGTKTTNQEQGTVACQDGNWLIPDGRLLVVTGEKACQVITMEEGYTIVSWFVATASGGKAYYRWNGTAMEETEIGE
ncbi:tip attachment protein j [Lucifera butyrica]|uniref:Tip attachment protein j n=1 Tax=Lucifera butyrica TaxID=1351585 RepID=A0A498R426_9FIRM|nr:phage tail protein [Lucifera butyrica]VBB05560.1 tip attachment protein j [Lucifera butyrica]